MYQGTMIENLIEIVMEAEEHAQFDRLVKSGGFEPQDGFMYELPESPAMMIGVA